MVDTCCATFASILRLGPQSSHRRTANSVSRAPPPSDLVIFSWCRFSWNNIGFRFYNERSTGMDENNLHMSGRLHIMFVAATALLNLVVVVVLHMWSKHRYGVEVAQAAHMMLAHDPWLLVSIFVFSIHICLDLPFFSKCRGRSNARSIARVFGFGLRRRSCALLLRSPPTPAAASLSVVPFRLHGTHSCTLLAQCLLPRSSNRNSAHNFINGLRLT